MSNNKLQLYRSWKTALILAFILICVSAAIPAAATTAWDLREHIDHEIGNNESVIVTV